MMLLKKLLWWPCLPLLLVIFPQALYVKRTTLRLPEATGSRTHKPESSAVNLLHVGESPVAGVGIKHLEQGITAQLGEQLSTRIKQDVAWQVIAQNGITIKELNSLLAEQPIENYDLALITMGVNDTTKFTSLKKWLEQLNQLRSQLNGPIIFTQVPPMAQFPALPAPLKYIIGFRAHLLDLELQRFCKKTDGVYYVGSKLRVEKEMMAEDGYHPSALGYENWAAQLLPDVEEIINNKLTNN